MFIEFTTTITHRVELGGEQGISGVTHAVEIEAGEAGALGTTIIKAIVEGGAKALLNSMGNIKVEVEEDDEDGE